jgi:hypothetical protein
VDADSSNVTSNGCDRLIERKGSRERTALITEEAPILFHLLSLSSVYTPTATLADENALEGIVGRGYLDSFDTRLVEAEGWLAILTLP